jgi:hypothetical protein
MTAPQLYRKAKDSLGLAVSEKNFTKIYKLFFERAIEHIVQGKHFTTGSIGTIYIAPIKKKPNIIDWGSTIKMWKEHPETKVNKQMVYRIGDEPIYSFVWSRGNIQSFPPKRMYRFRMSNRWRKRLMEAVVNEQKEY